MQTPPSFAPIAFGTNDVQIMIGTFDDFTFDDVIQVLGLSRQCLRLLVRRGEAAFSEVLLKAGQVLEARMPSSSEPEKVFNTLSGSAVRGSGLSFAVYHTQPTGPFPIPRARLSDLYARAKQAGQAPRARLCALFDRLALDAHIKQCALDHAHFEIVGELNGRLSTRSGVPPVGTESRSLMRVGSRITRGPVRLDGALVIGVTERDPTWGFSAGLTWVFKAFSVQ